MTHDDRFGHTVVLLDGGQATELEKDERVDLATTRLWSAALLLERNAHLEDVVVAMHRNYYLAGADVATTISYQTSLEGFHAEGITDSDVEMEKYYAKSVEMAVRGRELARKELEADPSKTRCPLRVAASIGCYGAALADGSEYRGNYDKTVSELVAWHHHRFAFFASQPGVDFLLCETIPCLDEVKAIIQLVNAMPSVRVIISVACRDESLLNSGEPISAMTELLKSLQRPEQLLAVGVNCTSPQFVASLLRSFECPCPKAAYPNSGEAWDGVDKRWIPASHVHNVDGSWWDAYLPEWFDAGVRVFGGCCRTGPRDIQILHDYFSKAA
ncbi:hypothetical protein Poli38472_003562 [Pythium oligandrum]|uniref:Hcy-binding domain-containing protein n=1 Tax=Pythium oligandrum TaxID=41045 RepID=A0A8K1C6V4_PYTOL|nr:hypothetical protein Poli38472_003562 [Pythium oligandrum]|eukprot:TMW57637.1 hypothetical protein Poli38472_003562 [Pythium oligandrum]